MESLNSFKYSRESSLIMYYLQMFEANNLIINIYDVFSAHPEIQTSQILKDVVKFLKNENTFIYFNKKWLFYFNIYI